MPIHRPRLILLRGFMCAGKTRVGRSLARRLGWRFADSDAEVRRRSGLSAAAFIRRRGLRSFRAEERRVLRSLLGRTETVVALGGGTPLPSARPGAYSVYLSVPEEELSRRIGKVWRRLPLIGTGEPAKIRRRVRALLARRRPGYRRADWTLDCARLSPERAAARIAARLSVRAR
ncbi:MAG: shikimate kinase [Elusimicrobiota bacterium]